MTRFTPLVLCFVWLIACGCGKKTAPAPEKGAGASSGFASFVVGKDERLVSELKAGDVIVSVNGTTLTRKTYDALLRGLVEAYRQRNPNANPLAVESYRQRRAKSLISEFLTKQVLLEEAKRQNLHASPEKSSEVLSQLAPFAEKKGLTVDDLAKSDDLADRLLYTGAKEQALILTLRQKEFGDKLTVTDADMVSARERIKKYNEMCVRTNELVQLRAQAICDRLNKGEDFFEIARSATEDKSCSDGVWGSFVRAEIEDAAVRNAAFTVPVGGIAGPFDTQEGLVIIKILEREGVDSVAAREVATVKLGRILLRLGETVAVPRENELREKLEKNRLQNLQGPWLAELQKRVWVEFPHGTNLFKKTMNRYGL